MSAENRRGIEHENRADDRIRDLADERSRRCSAMFHVKHPTRAPMFHVKHDVIFHPREKDFTLVLAIRMIDQAM
jgi:hypothetical protein